MKWIKRYCSFFFLVISLFFLSEAEMELFRMSVKIPGRNRAIFLLTYEELLQRRLGYYQHVTSVRPMQLVSKLSVAVTIVEHSRIKYLEVLPLRKSKTSGSRNNNKTDGISLKTFFFWLLLMSWSIAMVCCYGDVTHCDSHRCSQRFSLCKKAKHLDPVTTTRQTEILLS